MPSDRGPEVPAVDNAGAMAQNMPTATADTAPTTTSASTASTSQQQQQPQQLQRTDNQVVLQALRDPSHYEELSVIGNGKQFILHFRQVLRSVRVQEVAASVLRARVRSLFLVTSCY
jgi:hypothetical protein